MTGEVGGQNRAVLGTIVPTGRGPVGPLEGSGADLIPEGVPLPNPKDIAKRYGPDAWDWYLETGDEQGWLCAICGRPPLKGEPLVVDHCHDEHTLDGLIHRGRCNRMLDQRVRRYLKDPPGRHRRVVLVPEENEQSAIRWRETQKANAKAKRAAQVPEPVEAPAGTLAEFFETFV